MHRSMKVAAAVAALGFLAAVGASAAPRGMVQRGPDAVGGASMMPGRGAGPGMMGGGPGFGPATMMDGRGMRGDLPGWQDLEKLDKALTLDTAKERVATALKDWGYAELVVDSVVAWDGDFYALAKDRATGKTGLELFVDADYGVVTGAGAAGWNTKYGRPVAWPLPSGKTITADEARTLAQQWLDRSRVTTKYTLKVVELPGYFSVQLLDGAELSGLLAVNAYTSQVWYRGVRGGRFTAVPGSVEG
jgi:hypothetical protein